MPLIHLYAAFKCQKNIFPSLTILVLMGPPITVITKIGMIAKVEILKSTGSKVLGATVMDVVMQAKN